MESMTLEQASYLAEIIGVIVVVISLVYVAIQLKQNTLAMKQDSVKNMIETLRDATAKISQSADINEVLFTAMSKPNELDGAKKQRSYITFQNLLSAFELAHFQQTEGLLEPHQWSGYKQYLVDLCSCPGIQEYWDNRSIWFNPKFREYMDEVIFKAPKSPNFKLSGT